jgi:Flp pilus assembly protein protease CpaA
LNVEIIPWSGELLLILWLTACVIWDVRTRTVPGWLTVFPLLGAALARLFQGMWSAPVLVAGLILASDLPRRLRIPAAGVLVLVLVAMTSMADTGILVALLGVWLLWELSLMGGADAKILMVLVLILGDGYVVFPIAIAGAVLAVVAGIRKKRTIAYAAAIALGTLFYQLLVLLHPEGVIMKRFLSDSRALESTEVALLIAAVVLVAYAAYQVLGQKIADVVMEIAGKF